MSSELLHEDLQGFRMRDASMLSVVWLSSSDDLGNTISHPLGFGVTKLVSNVISQRSDLTGRAIAQNAQDDALRLWMYRISVSEDRNAKRISQVSQDFHLL